MAPGLRDVVTLPFRFGERAGRMVLGPVVGVAGRAVELGGQLIGRDGDAEREERTPATAAEAAAPRVTTDPDMPAATPAAEPAPAAGPAEPPAAGSPERPGAFTSADPTDVSSPPPLAAESADIGVMEAAGAGPVPATAIDEPEHVSTEATLVAESADLETADGIHTDLHVAEPWDGYRRAKAREVIEALGRCTPAQLAVVRLYESTHRARKTVLEAAERELARR